jgi:hypothetical protein
LTAVSLFEPLGRYDVAGAPGSDCWGLGSER